MEKILDEKSIRNILREEIAAYTKSKRYYWVEKTVLEAAIKLKIVDVKQLNVSMGDGTFKTGASFEGKIFVYVGDQIEV